LAAAQDVPPRRTARPRTAPTVRTRTTQAKRRAEAAMSGRPTRARKAPKRLGGVLAEAEV
jgi:hypothetical protein